MTESHSTPPERLGPYRIERCVGRGGMGEVFLAHDARLDRKVAVKRIRRDAPSDAELRERFRREARAVARLNHPAIVQIYDVVEEGRWDWIVLEYVEGSSLAELAAQGDLDGRRALDLARQVAEGLAHAHDRGFVHRDLKAENVRVTPEGRAKILDLGLAKALAPAPGAAPDDESLTRQGAVVGTPRVMAPEQVAGGPVDARADLFALGVLLYELLVGRSPFRAATPAATLRKVLTERPPSLRSLRPEVPAALDALVTELLAPRPGDRPADAAEVARRLGALASHTEVAVLGPPGPLEEETGMSEAPTGSRPGSPAPGVARQAARRARSTYREIPARGRWWWWGAAAAAALVVAGLLWIARDGPSRRVVGVLPPEAGEAGEEPAAAASGVTDAVLSGLTTLEGIQAVDPLELRGIFGTAADVAQAVAADEVVRAELACRGAWCRVTLQRIGAAGRVLAVAPPFEVSTRPGDVLELADAVRTHLFRLYPEHRPRSGVPAMDVRPEDYAAYLEVRRRELGGERLGADDLARLESLLETSPGFLGGYLLAANLARVQDAPETARRLAGRAHRLDPADPRPLATLARVELDHGTLEAAEEAVDRLERAAPGDPAVRIARARLLARQDRRTQAVEVWREVVDRRPSWYHLYGLADQEVAAGLPRDARVHLEELLRRSPGNEFGLSRLASLEARTGNLERAAELYRELIRRAPRAHYPANLGWILYLLGHYEEAAAAYRDALALTPGHVQVRFNLAEAEAAAGRPERARERYGAILADLEAADGSPALGAGELLIRALCLARLGRSGEAVALADRTLKEHPEEAQLRYQAAVVYALVGERYSALHHARAALEDGLSAAWFGIPAFDPLRSDPEFRALLESPLGD